MDKEFLSLLTIALEKEFNDAFLYLKEAEIFRRKLASGEKLAEVFGELSKAEFRHADRIAMYLLELGKNAKCSFNPYKIEPGLHETLESHVQLEINAYNSYDKMIGLCDDTDFKIILKGIRENEKEHLEKIRHILRKLK
jgi:rubrerythrin